MADQTLETNTNLWPPVLLFSVLYLGLSALVTTVLVIFDLNANSGVGIGVLVASTAVAARKFVVDHRRPFTRAEQLRFTLLAFAALLVISVLQIVAVGILLIGPEALPAVITDTRTWIAENTALVLGIVAVVLLIYFAIVYFASGWFSRMFAKRLAATGKI
jgi:hypothetical protein